MEDPSPELIDIERSGVEGLRGYTYMGMTDGSDGRKKMQEEKREKSRGCSNQTTERRENYNQNELGAERFKAAAAEVSQKSIFFWLPTADGPGRDDYGGLQGALCPAQHYSGAPAPLYILYDLPLLWGEIMLVWPFFKRFLAPMTDRTGA